MTRPTSFRLSEDLLTRLEAEASTRGTSVSAVVTALLDEGLKASSFPGIVYRDGPSGRRAGLAGGPDIWEIVRGLKGLHGEGEQRIRDLAQESGLSPVRIRLALDFYAAFRQEIDERIAAGEAAAIRMQQLAQRRERLLSG
jgi:hypothetical protein